MAATAKTLARLDAVEINARLLEWDAVQGYRRVETYKFNEPQWLDTVLLEKRLDPTQGELSP